MNDWKNLSPKPCGRAQVHPSHRFMLGRHVYLCGGDKAQQPRETPSVAPQTASGAVSGVPEPHAPSSASGGRTAAHAALAELLDLFERHSCDGITLGYTIPEPVAPDDFERWSRAAEGAGDATRQATPGAIASAKRQAFCVGGYHVVADGDPSGRCAGCGRDLGRRRD